MGIYIHIYIYVCIYTNTCIYIYIYIYLYIYTDDNLIFSTASAMKNKILRIDSRKEFNNLKIYQAPDILKSLNAYEYLGRDDRACLLEPGNYMYMYLFYMYTYVYIHTYICIYIYVYIHIYIHIYIY
jgi:hypothetical protein